MLNYPRIAFVHKNINQLSLFQLTDNSVIMHARQKKDVLGVFLKKKALHRSKPTSFASGKDIILMGLLSVP